MRIPNITSIRFFFALLVVVNHVHEFWSNRGFPNFNNWDFMSKGTEAVYAFFTLSGFLIIRKLYNEKLSTNKIDLKKFFLKRAFRILPLYYLILLIGLLYYRIVLPKLGFDFISDYNLGEGLLLSLTLFANVFATYSPGGILEILWSIAIEEQFYLFIAPMLYFIPNKRILIVLLFSTLLFLLGYQTNFMGAKEFRMLFFFFTISGIFSISLKFNFIQNSLWKIRFIIYSLVVVLFFTNQIQNYINNDIGYLLFCAILFSLFISVLSLKKIKLLESKPLVHLGDISYGIYMYHAIVMQVIGFLYLKTNLANYGVFSFLSFNLLIVVITILTAHFSKKYFENYFLRLVSKYN